MTTPMTPKPKITLTLESVPCDVPVANRLRSILKRLLRSYGFRCVGMSGNGLDEPKTPPTPANASQARPDATTG